MKAQNKFEKTLNQLNDYKDIKAAKENIINESMTFDDKRHTLYSPMVN